MKRAFPFIFIVCLLLLVRLFFYYHERHIYKVGEVFNETYSFTHEPKINSYGQYFFIGDVLVSLPAYPKFYYGDKIKLSGKVKSLNTKTGSLLTIENAKVTLLKDNNFFLGISKTIRQRIEDTVLTTIPEKEGGLMLGIILGIRDKIGNDFYSQLKNAGVLHIIAASGENVSITASLLLLLFDKIVKRRLALLFTALGVVFYAFLAGFDPSIVRAAIMALITFGALSLGRQTKGLYALLSTAFIMIFVTPSMLEDVSFQLSFLSTFGILVIKPLLDRVFSLRFLSILKEDITTTISAQIATLPVMLAVFGSYSLVTIPVNFLLLWTVPFLMIFGGIGALVSLVLPVVARIFILVSYPFLSYFTTVISVSTRINYSFAVDSLPISIIIGYYLILIAIVIKTERVERSKI